MSLSPAPWVALALLLPVVAFPPGAEAWVAYCSQTTAVVCEVVNEYAHFYLRCAVAGGPEVEVTYEEATVDEGPGLVVGVEPDASFPCIIQLTLNLPHTKVTVCVDDEGVRVSDDETCTMADLDDYGVTLP